MSHAELLQTAQAIIAGLVALVFLVGSVTVGVAYLAYGASEASGDQD